MTRLEYLKELDNALSNYDKWERDDQGRLHRLVVGDLVIRLDHSPKRTMWTLSAHGEVMSSSYAETISLAKAEAMQFANHYVRTMIDHIHA